MTRDLYSLKLKYTHEKRLILMKRDLYSWKEMYIHEKRPVFMKETYASQRICARGITCATRPRLMKINPTSRGGGLGSRPNKMYGER